jgi:DNA polymerase-3 subunit beta
MAEIGLPEGGKVGQQVIVPRKGVLELQRVLGMDDRILEVSVGSNHVRVQVGDVRFTSKLIDGRFPDYGRVIPNKPPRQVSAVREDLRHALQRAAILSNEKYRGIRFALKPNALVIQSHNPEQEEAEEELEVGYTGEELEIGFNVNYLLDALAAIEADEVHIGLTDSNSSCLIRGAADTATSFVVMPMRL